MSGNGFVPVLRRLLGGRRADLTDDAVLLDRYTATGDEAAFAGLVQRHGPMVWAVCRRVLRQEQATEDAFQATFLVLARKARSIQRNNSLPGWLYRVALRLALATRASLERHPESIPSDIPDQTQVEPATELVHQEVRRVLDEEVGRLPEKYRLPIILCFFQGRTHVEAASDLRCPAGTVSGRLARAKELLHARLTRRGITLAAGAVGTLLTAATTQAAPPSVAAAASTAGPAFLLSPSPAGRISPEAAALAQGLLRAGQRQRTGVTVAVLLAAGLVAGLVARDLLSEPDPTPLPFASEQPAKVTPARHMPRNRIAPGTGVSGVAASPDGQVIATACDDRTVKLWDAYTGLWIANLEGHGTYARSVAFSPDGTRLAAGADDGKIKVWDLRTRKEQITFTGHPTSVLAVSFGSNGRTLLSHHGHWDVFAGPVFVMALHLWDMQSGQGRILHEEQERTPNRKWAALSPDGKTLATTESNHDQATLTFWDVQGEKKFISRHQFPSTCLSVAVFAPDGKTLILPRILWDVKTQTKLGEPPFPPAPQCFAISPNGDMVAAADEREILVWDRKTGRTVTISDETPGSIKSLAFTPDGKTLLGASNSVRLWDVASGTEQASLRKGRIARILCARYSPDGKTLWTAGHVGDDGVWQPTVWDPQTRKQLDVLAVGKPPNPLAHARYVYCLAFSPDGTQIATGETGAPDRFDVSLSDARTRKHRLTIEVLQKAHTSWCHEGRDYLAFSPDGKVLATACLEEVKLWDTATGGALASLPRHTAWVTAVAFSPDGKTLAYASSNGTIKFWDVPSRKERLQFLGHSNSSNHVSLAFSPDGGLLVTGGTGGVKLWDMATGKEKLSLKAVPVSCVAFSFDGKIVAAASAGVRLWATDTGKELGTLVGHGGFLENIAFSPDGKTLVTSGGTTVRFWDISPPWNNSPPPPPVPIPPPKLRPLDPQN